MEKRSSFSGKLGFVLAAAGSAVGLGNIWRFPYLAAKYGGGIFLLIYLLLVVSFGFSIMVAEVAIGRKTNLSPIGAYRTLSKKYTWVGATASLIAFLILPYYSVIGGWVIKYFISYIGGQSSQLAGDEFFSTYISSTTEPIIWQCIFVLICAVVILKGVKRGIEKASKVCMPILIVLSIIVAIYAITLPGGLEGVKYFLIPDLSHFSGMTIVAALGQMFYSMSLAMGIMITYGSYFDKKEDIEKSVSHIELFDTGIAIIAGLMIIPAVFAFSGGDESALGAGPGLMFITLPKVFESMGMANIIGVIFFLLVLFAAATSAISLMEAVVATFSDQFKWSRKKATIIATVCAIILGMPSSLGFGAWSHITILGLSILDFMDFITNGILMPIVAFATCIFVGYVIKPKMLIDEVKNSSVFKRERLFVIMIKYLAPVCIAAILVSSVLSTFGIISI